MRALIVTAVAGVLAFAAAPAQAAPATAPAGRPPYPLAAPGSTYGPDADPLPDLDTQPTGSDTALVWLVFVLIAAIGPAIGISALLRAGRGDLAAFRDDDYTGRRSYSSSRRSFSSSSSRRSSSSSSRRSSGFGGGRSSGGGASGRW